MKAVAHMKSVIFFMVSRYLNNTTKYCVLYVWSHVQISIYTPPRIKLDFKSYILAYNIRIWFLFFWIISEAICPRQSATRSLTRLLNMTDNRIGVTPATCPRWDVTEDAKALYITRNMSGLPNKDFVAPTSRACMINYITI